jgi:hypothetical protein
VKSMPNPVEPIIACMVGRVHPCVKPMGLSRIIAIVPRHKRGVRGMRVGIVKMKRRVFAVIAIVRMVIQMVINFVSMAVLVKKKGMCDTHTQCVVYDNVSWYVYSCAFHAFCICSYLGCECPDGFVGPICEFTEQEADLAVCTLQCANNGFCRKGAKDVTILEKFEQIDQGLHRRLALSVENNTYAGDFEHCVCPKGYVGLQCEYKMDVCAGGEHVCLNGADCVPYRDNAGLHFECDCSTTNDPFHKYAGKYCEYASTKMCSSNGQVTERSDSYSFCVNDGECIDVVDGNGVSHPTCQCSDLFEGHHCEFKKDDGSSSSNSNGRGIDDTPPPPVDVHRKHTIRLVLFTVIFSVLAFLIILSTLMVWRRYRRRKSSSYYMTRPRSTPRPTQAHMQSMGAWTNRRSTTLRELPDVHEEDDENLYSDSNKEEDDDVNESHSISSMSTNRMAGGSQMGFSVLDIHPTRSGTISLMKSNESTTSNRSTIDPPQILFNESDEGDEKEDPNGVKDFV